MDDGQMHPFGVQNSPKMIMKVKNEQYTNTASKQQGSLCFIYYTVPALHLSVYLFTSQHNRGWVCWRLFTFPDIGCTWLLAICLNIPWATTHTTTCIISTSCSPLVTCTGYEIIVVTFNMGKDTKKGQSCSLKGQGKFGPLWRNQLLTFSSAALFF